MKLGPRCRSSTSASGLLIRHNLCCPHFLAVDAESSPRAVRVQQTVGDGFRAVGASGGLAVDASGGTAVGARGGTAVGASEGTAVGASRFRAVGASRGTEIVAGAQPEGAT